MSPRSSVRPLGVQFVIIVLVVASFSVVPSFRLGSAESAPASSLHTRATPATMNYTVASRLFRGIPFVNSLASNQSCALLDLYLPNGTNRLVLFDAVVNTTTVVQKFVPGGKSTYLVSLTAAGGAFILAWENLTTGREFWEKVTLSGKITYPTPGAEESIPWSFAYGNSARLYVSYERSLVELNATSLKVVANYTRYVPANVSVFSVLPISDRLYLGGSRSIPNGATNAYFGYLNLTSKKAITVSRTIKTYPSTLFGAFDTLVGNRSTVYAGGVVETYTSSPITAKTDQGLLYKFIPSTSAFKNESSLLPVKSWGVWALEPWGASSTGLSLNGYSTNVSNPSSNFAGGGIYTLSAGGATLLNQTNLFPKGYLTFLFGTTYLFDETFASYGWFFSGGYNEATGVAEAVAVNTGGASGSAFFAWGPNVNATGYTEPGCPETAGHYCYTVNIASSTLNTSDIALALENTVGHEVAWPSDGVAISLFNGVTSTIVATYTIKDSSWSHSVPISTLDTLVIYTEKAGAGQGLLGEGLIAIGTDGYSFTGPPSFFS